MKQNESSGLCLCLDEFGRLQNTSRLRRVARQPYTKHPSLPFLTHPLSTHTHEFITNTDSNDIHQMIRKRTRATTPPPTDVESLVHVPVAKRPRTTGPDAWNASSRTPLLDEEDHERDAGAGESERSVADAEDDSQGPRIHICQPPVQRAQAPSPPPIFEPKLEDAYASINHILHTTRHQRTHTPTPTPSSISNPLLREPRHQYTPARRSPLGLHSTQKEIPQTLSSSPPSSLPSLPHLKPRLADRLMQPIRTHRTPAKPINTEKEHVTARYEDINK